MDSAAVTVVAHAASLTAARGRSRPRVSSTCAEVANAARPTAARHWFLALRGTPTRRAQTNCWSD
ncbi:hypothetical protein PF005_g26595 [Phytophthora fragariae]|uniref:Uncharacterized protein n=1 Tax=Phytophthora fragariae TaxID=53985 RepID=A0A6A4AX87_9STRA|nr:hypothetical protein PF003_g36658 [Phytophthora fragariae]KAE9073841.1 hypothetical protein PF006_g28647 [Phytophthora fragariae]KAE9172682.1 hypothetical protein PF005_g26595 [Phytophthora fragariae]KAE9264347.1 hypothetical protein PF001_g31318 [Phytophthora fragariae]